MRSILLDRLENNARTKGEKEGKTQEKHATILRMIRKGRALDLISDATGWTVEQIQAFLKTQDLQPAR